MNYKKSIGESGFALVGGFRIKNLYVGRDFLDAWKKVREFGGFNDQLIIPTTLLQAKNTTYLSNQDIASFINAQLSISKEQLAALVGSSADLYKLLLEQTSLEVSAYLARVENLSNTGIMGNMSSVYQKIEFDKEKDFDQTIKDEWITFYQVITGMKRLKAFIFSGGLFTVGTEAGQGVGSGSNLDE